MAAEITLICRSHLRRVRPGPGGSIIHIAGNIPPPCDSQRFTLRRESQLTREEALAELAGEPS